MYELKKNYVKNTTSIGYYDLEQFLCPMLWIWEGADTDETIARNPVE